MSSKQGLGYEQATNVERRTWDKEKYEARAKARAAATASSSNQNPTSVSDEKAARAEAVVQHLRTSTANNDESKKTSEMLKDSPGVKEEFQPAEMGRAGPAMSQRAFLKSRSSRVLDLDSKVGTTEMIGPGDSTVTKSIEAELDVDGDGKTKSIKDGIVQSSTGVGWHCKVCDCYLKDSLTYLDHINGRKHQRYLGYSMRAERSTVGDVQARLKATMAANKRKKKNQEKPWLGGGGKRRREEEEEGVEEEEGRKRRHDRNEEIVREREEASRQRKEMWARKRKEEKEKKQKKEEEEQEQEEEDEEEEEEEVHPDIAAMMGFSSFGGGKK